MERQRAHGLTTLILSLFFRKPENVNEKPPSTILKASRRLDTSSAFERARWTRFDIQDAA
jgi:hypothetical protein